jgi:Glucodextranase, domain B
MGARFLLAAALVAVVVGAGALVADRWFAAPPEATEASPAPPAPPAPAADARRRTMVKAVRGTPERTRARAPSAPLHAGDVLDPDDVIRTGESGGASLAVGDVADVELASRTEVTVGQIADRVSRLQLGDGHLSAVVHGEKRSSLGLRVEVRGGDTAAESQEGAFAVLSHDGQVTLATTAGRAQLSAHQRVVEVQAGYQTTARRDSAPAAPTAIPPSLFIKLAPLHALVQREKQVVVSGRTTPGTVVTINGVRAVASESGEFHQPVPLHEGKNLVRVESEDVVGRRQSQSLPAITVDSHAPVVRTTVKW